MAYVRGLGWSAWHSLGLGQKVANPSFTARKEVAHAPPSLPAPPPLRACSPPLQDAAAAAETVHVPESRRVVTETTLFSILCPGQVSRLVAEATRVRISLSESGPYCGH